jgi:sugar lactone lactonase YvrE
MRTGLVAAAALSCLAAFPIAAGTPKNALGAIAVAPNGQWIVAAGDNLTLYVVEAATMTVHSRHWIGLNPEQLAFSADGKTLLVIDIESSLTFLDTTTFQARGQVKGLRAAAVMAGADQVVGMASPNKRDGKATTDIVVHALSDGRELRRIVADAEGHAVGGAADGSAIALLTRPFDTTAETKTKAPDDKKGFDKDIFEQQNDAKASEVLVFDGNGAAVARHPTWFSTTGVVTMAVAQGQLHVVPFDNENLRVDLASGVAEMYRIGDGLNYGVAFSADHARVVTGSLAAGAVGAVGGAVVAYKSDRVGNWPEYIEGAAFAPDGTVYAGTTAYRLWQVTPDGQVKAAVSIY